ncbi:ATP-binding cassette domain-containing protein [Lampropedia puyangensis]|uniref:ATP-binding cassette domain-containing protein n=1 Tax=Lampropedia puyangensis TaxID=1330072 RepID=A0A4S8F162_9BURK|nr:ATP-binding cassette domain-containing protein [Lampropedia puyangensis]THU00687.1 ATP-binding cassette domain-containing protein [Lampropedia puyangensis]
MKKIERLADDFVSGLRCWSDNALNALHCYAALDAPSAHSVEKRGSIPSVQTISGLDSSQNSEPSTPPVRGVRLQLLQVSKHFGDREVLKPIDLLVEPGEFVAIVGRSGCGKSTLLRLVAGLEHASQGQLLLDGAAQNGLNEQTRIMFQDARLLPWKSVLENVALGLPKTQRSHALHVLAQVGLADRAQDWPSNLSGGQRQRVALARALVHQPQLLLLDEPLGALDALTRIEMHALIENLWSQLGFTALLVTHDVQEAVALADRVLLIEDGAIALDQRIDLPHPRVRGSTGFANLEKQLLDRVLARSGAVNEAIPSHDVVPTRWQWAI